MKTLVKSPDILRTTYMHKNLYSTKIVKRIRGAGMVTSCPEVT